MDRVGGRGAMTQVALSNVAVDFGARTLFADVTFTVSAGERWGVLGRNGTGKTTLFSLITGALAPTRGQVMRAPGTRVALLEQHRDFGDARTVWEGAAGSFADLLALEQSLAAQAAALGEDASPTSLTRYGHDLERFEREGGYAIAPRVDAVLHGLGFDPAAARERELASLSGGERGRLGLARQLMMPADVLLLDEPTNHLDLETTRWLEQYLAATDETVVVISHDRAFLAALTDHILHVDEGTATAYVGGYESFARQRAERRLALARAVTKQRRAVAHEEDYIRRNIAGQNSKQAKGRRKRLERLPRLSPPVDAADALALRLDVAERGGDQVLSADRARLEVEGRVLVSNFSTRVMRGDRIGIVGDNGSGKSTLLDAIVGDRPVDGGELQLGLSTRASYYRQDLAQVPLERTMYDTINDLRPLWTRGQVQAHLARVGFSGDAVQQRPGMLSGGERARVALAIMMLSGANLLILDEPTNHLDVESIEALEDAVEGYPGTVLLASHDRALLRALATRVWVLHGQRITVFDGSFAEWEVLSEERAHATAVTAAEEESIRRVREHRTVEGRTAVPRNADRTTRSLRRAVDAAEAHVAACDAQVAQLTEALAEPALYARDDGLARSHKLGAALDAAQAALDAALSEWSAATEAAERAAGRSV
jgi:ATP-binding cassette subfamily F protein 3